MSDYVDIGMPFSNVSPATTAGVTLGSNDPNTPVVPATTASATTLELLGAAVRKAQLAVNKAKWAYINAPSGSKGEPMRALLAAKDRLKKAEQAYDLEYWLQEQEQSDTEGSEADCTYDEDEAKYAMQETEEARNDAAERKRQKEEQAEDEWQEELEKLEAAVAKRQRKWQKEEEASETLAKLYADAWTIRAPEDHPIWEEIEEWKAELAKWRRQPPLVAPRPPPRPPPHRHEL